MNARERSRARETLRRKRKMQRTLRSLDIAQEEHRKRVLADRKRHYNQHRPPRVSQSLASDRRSSISRRSRSRQLDRTEFRRRDQRRHSEPKQKAPWLHFEDDVFKCNFFNEIDTKLFKDEKKKVPVEKNTRCHKLPEIPTKTKPKNMRIKVPMEPESEILEKENEETVMKKVVSTSSAPHRKSTTIGIIKTKTPSDNSADRRVFKEEKARRNLPSILEFVNSVSVKQANRNPKLEERREGRNLDFASLEAQFNDLSNEFTKQQKIVVTDASSLLYLHLPKSKIPLGELRSIFEDEKKSLFIEHECEKKSEEIQHPEVKTNVKIQIQIQQSQKSHDALTLDEEKSLPKEKLKAPHELFPKFKESLTHEQLNDHNSRMKHDDWNLPTCGSMRSYSRPPESDIQSNFFSRHRQMRPASVASVPNESSSFWVPHKIPRRTTSNSIPKIAMNPRDTAKWNSRHRSRRSSKSRWGRGEKIKLPKPLEPREMNRKECSAFFTTSKRVSKPPKAKKRRSSRWQGIIHDKETSNLALQEMKLKESLQRIDVRLQSMSQEK